MPTQTQALLDEMRNAADVPKLGSISVNTRLPQNKKVPDYIERGGNLYKSKHKSNRGIKNVKSTFADGGTLTDCLKIFFANC